MKKNNKTYFKFLIPSLALILAIGYYFISSPKVFTFNEKVYTDKTPDQLDDITFSIYANKFNYDYSDIVWYENEYVIGTGVQNIKLDVTKLKKGENTLKAVTNDNTIEYKITLPTNVSPEDFDSYGNYLHYTMNNEELFQAAEATFIYTDSDYDGVTDNIEDELGLDKYSDYSNSQGISDYNYVALQQGTLKETALGYTYEEVQTINNTDITITSSGDETITELLLVPSFENTDANLSFYISNYNEENDYQLSIPVDDDNYTVYYINENGEKIEIPSSMVLNSLQFTPVGNGQYITVKKNFPFTSDIYFLIDNSASMYDDNYIAAKTNVTVGEENDVNFKRIDFAKTIINQLDASDYNFNYTSVVFGASTKTVHNYTANAQTAINALEKVKNNETYEMWDGTYIYSSIMKAVDEIKKSKTLGNKTIILLTDGEDGCDTYSCISSPEIVKAKLAGYDINLIMIAISKNGNNDTLKELEQDTISKLYVVNSADELYKITASIISNIRTDEEIYNKNLQQERILADSGFNVTTDGFSFSNFSSYSSIDGNCYGMARLAKYIYERENENDEFDNLKASIYLYPGYSKYFNNVDLTEEANQFLKKGKVYSFTSDYVKNRDFVESTTHDDIHTMELASKGIVELVTSSNELRNSIGNFELSTIIKNYQTDFSIYNLITRVHKEQYLFLQNVKIQGYANETSLSYLISELNNKKPVVIGLYSNYGGHAVLATAVRSKYENGTYKLYFDIYDSNNPGKTQTIVLTPNKVITELNKKITGVTYKVQYSYYDKITFFSQYEK